MGGRGSREKNTKVLFPLLLLLFIAPGREGERGRGGRGEGGGEIFYSFFICTKKGERKQVFSFFFYSLSLSARYNREGECALI